MVAVVYGRWPQRSQRQGRKELGDGPAVVSSGTESDWVFRTITVVSDVEWLDLRCLNGGESGKEKILTPVELDLGIAVRISMTEDLVVFGWIPTEEARVALQRSSIVAEVSIIGVKLVELEINSNGVEDVDLDSSRRCSWGLSKLARVVGDGGGGA